MDKPKLNASLSVEERVELLLKEMTLWILLNASEEGVEMRF